MYEERFDPYRILDVVNSLDENHFKSKNWLADELWEVWQKNSGIIHVAAGWYGLQAYLLQEKMPPEIKITSSDIDPECKTIGKVIFGNMENTGKIKFEEQDTVLDIEKITRGVDIYVNTSIEHIERKYVELMLSKIDSGKIVALQSNNWYNIPSHVNCSDSLEDFISYVKPHFKYIMYEGEMEFEEYNRYMIIGMT
tara:strand:+ start:116 stop:703 length:588 start_codon:yes stop_codon:yes gene_type:complete